VTALAPGGVRRAVGDRPAGSPSAVAVGVLTPLVSFALVAPVGRLRQAGGLAAAEALLGSGRLWPGAAGIIALQLDLLLVRQARRGSRLRGWPAGW
jgi:hypothetical protein